MSSSCTLLYNPKAGALHGLPSPGQLTDLAKGVGLDATVVPTKSVAHLRRTLRQTNRFYHWGRRRT